MKQKVGHKSPRRNGAVIQLPAPQENGIQRDDLIARANRLVLESLGALQESLATAIRHDPVSVLRSPTEPPSEADRAAAKQAASLAIELLSIAANLTEQNLADEEASRLRDHIREISAYVHGLNPQSERQAQALLVELIEGAATWVDQAEGESSDNVGLELDSARASLAEWVLSNLETYYPTHARALRHKGKQNAIVRAVEVWVTVEWKQRAGRAIAKGEGKWVAFAEIGRGIFTTNTPKHWKLTRQRYRAGGMPFRATPFDDIFSSSK